MPVFSGSHHCVQARFQPKTLSLIVKFMVFLAPATLLGLLLVSLPLLIHLLVRRRGRLKDFPSLRFLRETPSFKLYPRRIRQPLLLALRAAAIILLVLGLARPLFISSAQTPEVARFILIDASLSMRTQGRAEAAREQARSIINQLASGERASVIALASEAMVLAELTGEKERLLAAVERYQPMGGACSYSAGFLNVRAQLLSQPKAAAHVDIISDFQAFDSGERAEIITLAAAGLNISTYEIGTEVERNAFLVDETLVKTERGYALSATELVSAPDGRSGARRVWTLEAGEGASPEIEWRTQTNKQVTGRLKVTRADDFDADDERFFAFAPRSENRVLLIEDGSGANPYLSAALEAGQEETTRFAFDRRDSLPEMATDLAPYSLIVLTFHGTARERETRVLLEYARAGGTVWMFLGRDLDAASWNSFASGGEGQGLPFESVARKSDSQSLTFGAMDTDASALRGLDESARSALSSVRVSEGYTVTPRPGADTLIRWSDGTQAFIAARTGSGQLMALGSSLDRASSDLGLTPAFPALVSSVLNAAEAAREPLSKVIGEAVRLNVAPETLVSLTDAQGRASVAKARELVRRPLNYFSEPGIYQLEFNGQQKFLAFNAPGPESERTLTTADELKRRFSANEAQGALVAKAAAPLEIAERRGSLWRYFLAAAFLLLIAELFVALRGSEQRRVE
jgi:hypothetical protein